MKSRGKSPQVGVSPVEKSFSLKKGVKCTTIFKGKLTEQEVPSGADGKVSRIAFVTDGASFEAKLCSSAVQRTETQQRCTVVYEVGYCDSVLIAMARLLTVPKLAIYNWIFDEA